ncbi:hypothetical protein niasHS_008911 [Heterodera schachtii]|uniref:BTB domain-containing protein n=1 Tax=Heterodera schachtii TaxID=97005 RepID=A0ABD2J6J1_HETSC
MASSKSGILADRMKNLLDTAKHADAHFLVGDGDGKELLSAHKGILVSASDVFEAMFRFDSKNGKSENVPDVEAEAFKVMLSFIYADDLSELDGDNAMAVLCAADKYGIDRLISHCVQIPIQNLSNVFLAHAYARLFNLEDFAKKCLRFICQNAGQLFDSEEFLQIDQNLLCEIFGRDQLVISNEFGIWKAALHWADEKCRQNAIECSAENRRAALGPALLKIRFPLIPSDAFVKQIVPSGVLSNEEFVGVYQFHCHPNFCGVPGLNPLKFPWNGRISDWNTANGNRGTLAMEIGRFSEFTQKEVGSKCFSDYEIRINGFGWKILAGIKPKSNQKWLGFYLCCTAPKEDANWQSKCSATFRIVSQKHGTEDLIGKFNERITKTKNGVQGFNNFIAFSELMDPSRGLYDQNEDKVTLVVDAIVEEQITERFFISDPNKSNGTIEMEMDKLSEFSREICGSERSSETVHLMGLSWKVSARIMAKEEDKTKKYLGIGLKCFPKDSNWSSECSAKVRIFSKKSGTKHWTQKCDECNFNAQGLFFGFNNLITFADLIDPSKGLYDENEDKVTLAIDFAVEEKKGTKRKLADE